jgi:hypothetical protein
MQAVLTKYPRFSFEGQLLVSHFLSLEDDDKVVEANKDLILKLYVHQMLYSLTLKCSYTFMIFFYSLRHIHNSKSITGINRHNETSVSEQESIMHSNRTTQDLTFDGASSHDPSIIAAVMNVETPIVASSFTDGKTAAMVSVIQGVARPKRPNESRKHPTFEVSIIINST